MSQLLCPSPTGVFLIMGLWHFSWGSREAGAAWRLGVLDVQVLGVTATAPLSPMLTQPGFELFKSCFMLGLLLPVGGWCGAQVAVVLCGGISRP